MLSNSSKDLMVALGFSLVALLLAAYFDANESFIEWSAQYEEIELDELPIAAAAIALAMAWFSWRRWRDLTLAQHALKQRLIEI